MWERALAGRMLGVPVERPYRDVEGTGWLKACEFD